jgi:DNA-binding transcriptional LysR family regulator
MNDHSILLSNLDRKVQTDFCELPFLPVDTVRAKFPKFCRGAVDVLQVLDTNEEIKQSVQAGMGIGIISSHGIEMELELKTHRLVVLDVDSFPTLRQAQDSLTCGRHKYIISFVSVSNKREQ